jgi:hypothetical protein
VVPTARWPQEHKSIAEQASEWINGMHNIAKRKDALAKLRLNVASSAIKQA